MALSGSTVFNTRYVPDNNDHQASSRTVHTMILSVCLPSNLTRLTVGDVSITAPSWSPHPSYRPTCHSCYCPSFHPNYHPRPVWSPKRNQLRVGHRTDILMHLCALPRPTEETLRSLSFVTWYHRAYFGMSPLVIHPTPISSD